MNAYETVKQLFAEATPIPPKSETLSREPVPSLTTVPKPIKDWADQAGRRCSWQQESDARITMVHSIGISPLHMDDLPEPVQEELRKVNPYITKGGNFTRSGAVLCTQTFEDHERSMWETHERNARLRAGEDREKFKEDAERMGVVAVWGDDWADTPSDIIGGDASLGGSGYSPY